MKKIHCLILLLLCTPLLYAQGLTDAQSKQIDQLFEVINKHDQGMGTLSIFQNGKEVYTHSHGFENIKKGIKATANTKYAIGSISKTYTATMIMMAVQQKKISLETTLDKYFPSITNAKKITIRQLLEHQSGVANIIVSFQKWMTQPINRKSLLQKIQEAGVNFEPGAKFEYSNSGYILLSWILEDIHHEDYNSLLQRLICQPLKLTNTYVPISLGLKSHEARSYHKLKDWRLQAETNSKVTIGAGAIISTAKEVNIFLDALMTGKLTSPQSLKAMVEPFPKYGLGIIQVPFYDLKGVGHTGGIDGFQSNAFYFEKGKASFVYLSNGVGPQMPLNDILIRVLSIFYGKPFQMPTFEKDIKVDQKTLDQYVGVYTSPQMPIDLTITRKDGQLMGQGTGQPQFPLQAVSKTEFHFKGAGVVLIFDASAGTLKFRQGSYNVEMTKKK